MVTIFVRLDGETREVRAVDPAWLMSGSGASLWVDLMSPTPDESAILRTDFGFHELAIEDAIS
ncbi:MAG: hypothetical protein ACM3NQ_14205, partial [Bacteroidales bacterium]